MNKCFFSGLIGKKGIELRYAGEKPVASYSLAIQEFANGEKKYTYVDCVTWGKQAEFLKNNEDKIKSLIVETRFNTRNYEGNNGKVYIKEFVTNDVEVKEWKNDGTSQPKEENGFFPIEDSQDLPWDK